jgi:site-specific DNA-methyltransferase (adenine-specific)
VKPYYDEDGITIYHADCREVLPTLADGSVDLVLTDPPWGIGKAEWDTEFQKEWLEQVPRLGTAVCGVFPGVWNLLSLPDRIDRLYYVWTLCVYIVNGMTRGAIGFGNWMPCVIYADGFGKGRCHRKASDVSIVSIGHELKPAHPSPKPLPAMMWVVQRLPGAVVLDPFAGSGTTLVAAKANNRRAIGIEIEERYCEIAAKRLAQGVFDFGKPETEAVA